MSLALRWKWLLVVITLLRCATGTPTPLSLTPSTNWYGDDGSWSAISIRVGTPPQWVDVLVSSGSSETWVVSEGGCQNNSICAASRGGLFRTNKSSTWVDEGFFELGLDTQLGFSGYGDYGLDVITFGTTGVTLSSAIIANIETSEYWLGFFGLGIVPGNFTNVTPLSAISGLVEKEDAIPSHSYGFTAGAVYQQKEEPVSLTLGGYDANRFVPHNISFELNPSQQPQVYIDSISVMSAASNNWTNPTQLLSTNDRVSAVIDSSTPYLWLPPAVCDQFALSLGLSYNSTLNLYTFDGNASQHTVLSNSRLSFIFSLSDLSSSTNIVNITLPYEAFDLQLSYPAIPNTTYGSSQATKNYFPLARATNEAQYTIGRAFLQEAYLITDYERNNFSIHQAVHTADPLGNTSLVAINRPSTSLLSGPSSAAKSRISTGAIVGIAVGATILVAILAFLGFYFWWRQKQPVVGDEKASLYPSSSFVKIFPRRFRPKDPETHEVVGSINHPTEVGADATHERFELAAPFPVELNSESNTLAGTTENGSSTQSSGNLSPSELAKRKPRRQLSPQSPISLEAYPVEKSERSMSPSVQYYPPDVPDNDSPLVSPMGPGSGSLPSTVGPVSPVSPGFMSSTMPPLPISPPPTYRHPGEIGYAGRLPRDVVLPLIIPKPIGPDGATLEITEPPSTLGSHYTQENAGQLHDHGSTQGDDIGTSIGLYSSGDNASDVDMRPDESKFRQEDVQNLRADMQTREIEDPWAHRRRLKGEDLVHVPQLAENRFSWEEE